MVNSKNSVQLGNFSPQILADGERRVVRCLCGFSVILCVGRLREFEIFQTHAPKFPQTSTGGEMVRDRGEKPVLTLPSPPCHSEWLSREESAVLRFKKSRFLEA
jgi:hypothetical protein